MRMRPTDINIAGAIDLSSLRAPAGSGPAPQGAPPAPGGAAPAGAPGGAGAPGAFVFDASEATFEDLVLRRSLQVPVLVDFWASWCGPCKQLSPVLERLAEEAGGAWVLAKVDVDANQALSGQLGIQSIPAVLLALGGRLVQGFTGALPERDVRAFLEQVLAAAAQAGLSGQGAAPDGAQPGDPDAGPPPEPEVLAAEDALERGDFAGAVAAYDALLARRPTDVAAQAARASVLLFQRTDGVDADTVLRTAQAGPDDVPAQLAAADLEVLGDQVEQAAARLIALVKRTDGEDRDAVRARLLELLAVLDPQDPRVVTARRSLANALF